jgi:hypothetical protein
VRRDARLRHLRQRATLGYHVAAGGSLFPPETPTVPLLNLNEEFEAELEGISFRMTDGERTVQCLVTDEALADAMGDNPTRAQQAEWFRAHRDRVEEVASTKYEHAKLERDGTVRVGTRDLNPDFFRDRWLVQVRVTTCNRDSAGSIRDHDCGRRRSVLANLLEGS